MANALNSVAEDLIYFGQEVLVMLMNSLKLVSTVKRSYSGAEAAAGSHIQIPMIDIGGAAATRSVGGAVSASDVTSSFVTVDMVQIYKAVTIDNLSRTFSNVDLMSEAAQRLAYSLAEAFDTRVAALWNQVPYETGSLDGTSAFVSGNDIDKLSDARRILTVNKAPMELANLNVVLNPSEAFNLRKLTSYKQVNTAGQATGREQGALGQLVGFQIWESQQIQNATLTATAVWASPAINNGPGYPIGTTSIAVNGLGAGTIKAGSGFTLGGFSYVVTADAAISSNAATLVVYPPLKSAVANAAVLTPTSHSAIGSMNLAYHSDGILAVARSSAPFANGSGVTSVLSTDEQTGLSVRLSHQSTLLGNPGMQEAIVADVIVGTKVIRPEFVVKVTGVI